MLLRPRLTYHPGGHPVFDVPTIDRYAERFLTQYFQSHLREPTPLRASDLISLVKEQDGVDTIRGEIVGADGERRLGRLDLKNKRIHLADDLFGATQLSSAFVTAHEIAHWLLHRDCQIGSLPNLCCLPADGDEIEEISQCDIAWPSLSWIEWQASKLASALVMPRQAAINAVWAVQSYLELPLRKGIIYDNCTPDGRQETEEQFRLVAGKFEVSKKVVRNRLWDLRLFHVQDQRRADSPKQNPFRAIAERLR